MAKPSPGLRKRGQIWHIEKTIQGTGVRICESTGEKELAAAERYLAIRVQKIRDSFVYGKAQSVTFDQASAKFVEEQGEIKTFQRYAESLKALMPFIGHLNLTDIHNQALEPFIEYRKNQGRTAGTINRDLAALKRVLYCAHALWRDGNGKPWLESLPVFQLSKGEVRKPRPITQAEQAGLLKVMPDYLAQMALFALHTGLRAQELCGLRWEWEHMVTGTGASVFVIPETAAKNQRERIVPLNTVAASIIEAQRPKTGSGEFVFTVQGHRLSRPTNKAWNQAKAKVGLSGVRWHDLRHTFGMRLRAQGVGEEDRADLLGHHKGKITTHYSKAQIGHLIECVEKLCQIENDKPELTLIKRARR